MKAYTHAGIGLLLLLLVFSLSASADTTFLKYGASWKYLDDGSAPAANWKEGAGFNDNNWPAGNAAFGYTSVYQRTAINPGANPLNKTITTYFRKTVNIPNPAEFAFFKFNMFVDDGAVVFLNGKEIYRVNMPAGTIQNNTLASTALNENGNIITSQIIKSNLFKSGANDIAIEVHQNNVQSRSMVFDLELAAITGTSSPEITRGPLLQMVNTSAITIKWRTNLPSSSTLRYGVSETALSGSVSDKAMVTEHELRITDLKPDTKYFYSVGTNNYTIKGRQDRHTPLPEDA